MEEKKIELKVYMAGTMDMDCNWRGFGKQPELNAAARASHDGYNGMAANLAHNSFMIEDHSYIYVGPYVHQCNHAYNGNAGHNNSLGSRRACLSRSVAGINACDIFIAYIDRLDLFGTFMETGLAIAMKKYVIICADPKIMPVKEIDWCVNNERPSVGRHDHELWFLMQSANWVEYLSGYNIELQIRKIIHNKMYDAVFSEMNPTIDRLLKLKN